MRKGFLLIILAFASVIALPVRASGSDCSVARGISKTAHDEYTKALTDYKNKAMNGGEAASEAKAKLDKAKGNQDHWDSAVEDMCKGETPMVGF